ncbi:hypothetical protein PAMP_012492 [Pampus punctatissimus]
MDKSAVFNTESDATLDVDKCHICLSLFTEQTVASLNTCQHVFCLECILQWSQTANTCPVDRISFAFIHPGGDIDKKIKVRTHKKDDDEEQRSHAVICEECGRSDQGSVVEEISDGELTDLLAEVDEMPSTSSRLRPSTINQPSSSAGQRHSQRLQSRASSSPNPHPQTFKHVPKYLLRASKPADTTDEAVELQHSNTSNASVRLKTRKRRKCAT